MSAEALSVADDMLRSGFERWLRLEEAKAEIGDDLKELFAELKGHGFTPKALRESFRRVRNINDADQQEHDALVDLYVESLSRRARPAPAHEKRLKNSPQSTEVVTPVAHAKPAPAESKGGTISAPILEAAREMRARVGEFVDEHITQSREETSSLPTAKPDEVVPPPSALSGALSPLAVPPAEKAPEPVPQTTPGSGAPIPDELIVEFLRKDHPPTNPSCQKPATCKWARSMASCSACASAAAAKRKLVAA